MKKLTKLKKISNADRNKLLIEIKEFIRNKRILIIESNKNIITIDKYKYTVSITYLDKEKI